MRVVPASDTVTSQLRSGGANPSTECNESMVPTQAVKIASVGIAYERVSFTFGAEVVESVRQRVEQVARAFDIEGYARLDVFWDQAQDIVYLLEINSLCGLTEATVFYSQWLADEDSLPPWAVLDRIVAAGIERAGRLVPSVRAWRAG